MKTIAQNERDQLQAEIERQRAPTRAWKPDEGDQLVGTIVRRNRESTDRGDEVEVLHISTEEGEKVPVWCSSKVLADLVREKNPQTGDLCMIEYFGTGETRAGREFKRFGMSLVRAGGKASTVPEPVPAAVVAANGKAEELGITDDDVPF